VKIRGIVDLQVRTIYHCHKQSTSVYGYACMRGLEPSHAQERDHWSC
jgi:hypothetical protein